MSNDYRNREHDDSRWYYGEGKRYVPRSMIEEERRREYERRRRQQRQRPPVRQQDDRYGRQPVMGRAMAMPPDQERAMRIARAVFVSSLSLLILILVVLGGVYTYISRNILDQITFEDDSMTALSENLDDIVLESDDDPNAEGEELTGEQTSELVKLINSGLVSEENLYRQDGVTNILLLGTDNRGYNSLKGSRTDVMIVLSINDITRQIVMTSLLRDVCVSIPGRTDLDKLNSAYAYGGAPLAVRTVETNFGIDIDRYIAVNFYAFIGIVDALGGIRLDVTESERLVMNDYIAAINNRRGLAPDDGKLYTSGKDILLTGKQTLGYVRNRYTGSGDFSRTERQRIVLDKLIRECREASVPELLNVLEATAANMTTNYSESEILSFAANAMDYLDYEIITSRIPIDDSWESARLNGMAIVRIDMSVNRQELLRVIYGIQ